MIKSWVMVMVMARVEGVISFFLLMGHSGLLLRERERARKEKERGQGSKNRWSVGSGSGWVGAWDREKLSAPSFLAAAVFAVARDG